MIFKGYFLLITYWMIITVKNFFNVFADYNLFCKYYCGRWTDEKFTKLKENLLKKLHLTDESTKSWRLSQKMKRLLCLTFTETFKMSEKVSYTK
jgi:hypothetical protein